MSELSHPFPVGVYGTRNVCQQVVDGGFVERSFVAGMSTGWSGNLGYPLPTQWAFDQIKEESTTVTLPELGISPAKNITVGIDRLVVSNRGVAATSHRAFERNILWLNNYLDSALPPIVASPDLAVCHPFRVFGHYEGTSWSALAGDVDQAFVSALPTIADEQGWPFAYFMDDPHGSVATDASHLMATMNVYVYDGVVPQNTAGVAMSEVGGWIGDLATFMVDWLKAGAPTAARAWAQDTLGDSGTSFSEEDLHADIDAANAARYRLDNSSTTADAIVWALDYARGGSSARRYTKFVDQRWDSNLATAKAAATAAVVATSNSNAAVLAAVQLLVNDSANSGGVILDLVLLTHDKRIEIAEGFVNGIWKRAGLV